MILYSLEKLTSRFGHKTAEISLDRERDRLIVDARDSHVLDEDVNLLAECSNLVYLNLAGTRVTNHSLNYVAKCSRLEFLDIGSTRCDLSCLPSLVRFSALKGLGLSGITINAQVTILGQLRKLEVLDISRTCVPKDAVRALLQLTALSSVNLAGNGLHPCDFADLDILEDDSRTVSLEFSDDVRVGIAMSPIVRS